MAIDEFKGKYEFLSNFYPCSIFYENLLYPSVEHAYQAAKSLDLDVRFSIADAETAGQAKRLGRKVVLRKDWEDVRIGVMYNLLCYKFVHNMPLAEQLLNTGEEELIEGNTWGDTYWGVCKGVGQNNLGRLLMSLRGNLKRFYFPKEKTNE